MKAGLELNRLVAEKVMGWEIEDGYDGPWAIVGEEAGLPERRILIPVEWYMQPWCPSTDIDAAWEVVEEVIAEPETKCSILHGVGFEGWKCRFFGERRGETIGTAYADDAPEAICLAALEAVGVDVEESKQ